MHVVSNLIAMVLSAPARLLSAFVDDLDEVWDLSDPLLAGDDIYA